MLMNYLLVQHPSAWFWDFNLGLLGLPIYPANLLRLISCTQPPDTRLTGNVVGHQCVGLFRHLPAPGTHRNVS